MHKFEAVIYSRSSGALKFDFAVAPNVDAARKQFEADYPPTDFNISEIIHC